MRFILYVHIVYMISGADPDYSNLCSSISQILRNYNSVFNILFGIIIANKKIYFILLFVSSLNCVRKRVTYLRAFDFLYTSSPMTKPSPPC